MTLISGRAASGVAVPRRAAFGGAGLLSEAAALAIGVEHRLELTRRDLVHPVSGLPNRTALVDRLGEAVAQRDRLDALLADGGLPPAREVLAAVCLDLDHFQQIGAALGPSGGDAALRAVAHRIEGLVHPGDTVAQTGDDEFVVVCPHLTDPEVAGRFADALVAGLHGPIALADGRPVTITASAGVAVCDRGGSPEALLTQAVTAMARAKDLGRNRAERFDPRVGTDADAALDLRIEVGRALLAGEFVAHFQPIVDLADGRVVGFEALVRWEHPERGVLTPFHFLEAVRDAGLTVDLGERMLEQACRFARRLSEVGSGVDGPYVGVNIDNEHLTTRGFADSVAAALGAADVDGRRIVLELVESDRIDPDGDGAAVLGAVHALGVGLAIDDFGTGYSSLGYLQRLPVQVLKLDGSFVRDVVDNPGDRAIVGLVVQAAAVLGVTVVAECVEDDAQVAVLTELGCTRAQGYRFGRPVPADAAVSLVAVDR